MNDCIEHHVSPTKFAAPRKSLGQNFLQDANIVRKVLESLNVQDTDLIIEIGPGRGALTEYLLEVAQDLYLIEYDRDLASYWKKRAELDPKLTVYGVDVLKFNFAELSRELRSEHEQPFKVIGNLPYNISSPVLFHLMKYADFIHSQVVMLQKEVVERLAATPGSKQYGRLSVMLQYRYDIENLFVVSPNAFFPPPKVDSAIARLTPKQTIGEQAESIDDLELLVKHAFSQRRKTLRNTLKPVLDAQQINSVRVDPSLRAEMLSVGDFVRLANLYTRSR